MSSTKKDTTKTSIPYENNPFTVAVDGLRLLFQLALPIAIVTIVISIAAMFTNMNQQLHVPSASAPALSSNNSAQDTLDAIQNEAAIAKQDIQRAFENNLPEVLLIIGGVVLLFIFFATILASILDYTAAHLSNGQKVTFSDALATSLREFFPYLWLRILVAVKIFLWSLLFIVPGIIMSVRYSLAGVSFYDKSLGAQAATKDSSRLVKGAWLTTNASFTLFNLITLGLIQTILRPGTSAVLYRQLNEYDKKGKTKPKAHVLSWLTLIIPYILLILAVLLIVSAMIYFLQNTQ
jgi:uncharacterized membrane protein